MEEAEIANFVLIQHRLESAVDFCIICSSPVPCVVTERTENENSDALKYLKVVCDTLHVFHVGLVLGKLKDYNVRRHVKFCTACQEKLQTITIIQQQLDALAAQIKGLRNFIKNSLLTEARSIGVVLDLRSLILAQCDAKVKSGRGAEELIITGDPLSPLAEQGTPHSVVGDHFYEPFEDDVTDADWNPATVNEKNVTTANQRGRGRPRKSPRNDENVGLTKPCHIKLIRLDNDKSSSLCGGRKIKTPTDRRLRQLLKRIKVKKEAKDKEKGEGRKLRRPSTRNKKATTSCTVSGCEELFINAAAVNIHVKRDHEGNPTPYSCRACSELFEDNMKLRAHRKTHAVTRVSGKRERGKPRKAVTTPCTVSGCEELFTDSAAVSIHIKKDHEKNPTPYDCIACGSMFESNSQLRSHYRDNHAVLAGLPSKKEEKIFECPSCKRRFKCFFGLESHLKKQGGACLKKPLPLNSYFDIFSVDRKKFVCGVCQKRFIRTSLLLQHIYSTHLKDTYLFVCEFCHKPFKQKSSLQMHQQLMHRTEYVSTYDVNEEKLVEKINRRTCQFCSKSFINLSARKKHEQQHTGYKFICGICGAGASSNASLKVHQRNHSEERNFACDRCPIRFNRPDKLTRHLKVVHEVGGKKEFPCAYCEKAFWDMTARKRHCEIMHRDAPTTVPVSYRCEICNYTCVTKGYLTVHRASNRHKRIVAELESKKQLA